MEGKDSVVLPIGNKSQEPKATTYLIKKCMKTKIFNFVDKSTWPKGEWDFEPDKIQWQDEETGLPCLAVRHRYLGHWCGYVGVTEEHPYFGKHYYEPNVDVHGGLTFGDFCSLDEKEHGICHIVEEGENDRVYWFGFDAAHAGDISPAIRDMFHGTYKNLSYIQQECRNLAKQLKEKQ